MQGIPSFLTVTRQARLAVLGPALALALAACGGDESSTGAFTAAASTSGSSSTSSTSGSASSSSAPTTSNAPQLSGTPASAVVLGETYSFTPKAAAQSSARLSFLVSNLPSWASFNSSTGELSGTPMPSDLGVYANIQIRADDGATSVALPAFSITVVAPLILSGHPAASAVVGSTYAFQPTTNAAPGTTLKFSAQNLPAWATLNASTGELSGTPNETGTLSNILLSATDGIQISSLPPFSITVSSAAPSNIPPSISGQPPSGVVVGSVYTFTPTANDPNGRSLSFSVQNLPPWASFNTSNGQLTGAPSLAQTQTYPNVVIGVSDGALSASLPAFTIRVVQPLSINGTPTTQVNAGESYTFRPTTNAANGATLTFSVKNRPAWASFSSTTGALSGAPTATQGGTYPDIVISVTDGVQLVKLPAFAIEVVAPLAISGTPSSTVVAGQGYAFRPTTNAPAGTHVSFQITNKPAWASFNASSGALSGTPAASQAGTYTNIRISVSNGSETSTLAAFAITVTNPPAAPPVISGSPGTSVNAGSAYSFNPTASGPAGRTLTFSIEHQPSWASFNTSTGALTGTPGASNAGTYADIVISVSDGTASASLAAFSITVNAAATGTATLNWTPVTENTNGTAVNSLAGYRIYYGTSASAMTSVVTVASASATSYQFSNLAAGTWYFGMTAYTSTGAQSAMSNIGSVTVD